MVPLAMLIVALPAGLLSRNPRRALTITLGVFASLLIVQSIVVATSSTDQLALAYWIVQILALLAGLVLLRLGMFLRARKSRPRSIA